MASFAILANICAQNSLKDWNFETQPLLPGSTKNVNVDAPGWFSSFGLQIIKVLNDKTPTILTDSVKYDDAKLNTDSVSITNPNYRCDILRLVENGNHYIHVDPISTPANSGFDLMIWQEVFDLTPGAYELRFKVRSSITSFQSNVVDPAYPGVHVNIKDVTGTFANLTDVVPSFRTSDTWRTHIVNFTVKAIAASTRVSFWFDRFCSIDLDDVELIALPDVIPTYKATASSPTPPVLQNEGLADFESGNYPSTLAMAPTPGKMNPTTNVFTNASQITAIPAFPVAATIATYGPNKVDATTYLQDTVFWTPYISQGADPIQGAISWRGEVRNLTTDSINAYKASLSTPCFNAKGANGTARKVKLIFWARTDGKDMLVRVDNISGSGASTAARKVQNVLISGTEYKEYIVNDTMPAILPMQSMNSKTLETPRYRLNLRTPHSVVYLDYMRLEAWDGITGGSPDAPSAIKTTNVDKFAKIATSGDNVVVAANETVSVKIYSLSGSLVKQQMLDGNRLVNMAGKSGVYIVKVQGRTGSAIQKVILK